MKSNLLPYLAKGKEILDEKFGVKPERTRIIYHGRDSWQDFLGKKETKADGMFLPRSMEVNVPEDVKLTDLIHEYFGHGLFCEYALKGKRIVKYEQMLANLEEKILGEQQDSFSKNAKIGIFQSDKTKLIGTKSVKGFNEYDFALLVDQKDKKKVNGYLTLKEKSKNFFLQALPLYEGFAVWMEGFLLEKFGKNSLLAKRKKEFPPYQQLKNFERNNGIYSLWYNLGFPKVFRKDILINIIKEETKDRFKNIKFAILYGSQKPYSDIDFLVVFNDTIKIENYVPNDPDILEVNEKEFIEKIKLLDPKFTEPLFTGELVKGKIADFRELKRNIKRTKPNAHIVSYLQKKAKECYKNALSFERLSEKEPNNETFYTLCYLLNQSFNLSYITFAKEYKKSKKPLTLEEVKESSAQLSSFFEKLKKSKRSFY